jgi:hypothetical protein
MTDLPEWVDGLKFAEWLDDVRPDFRQELSETDERTVARFREPGVKGSVEVVDRICVALFLHLSEIPDDVWTTPPNKGRPQIPAETRAEIITLLGRGLGPAEISRRLQVGDTTVSRIRKQVAQRG